MPVKTIYRASWTEKAGMPRKKVIRADRPPSQPSNLLNYVSKLTAFQAAYLADVAGYDVDIPAGQKAGTDRSSLSGPAEGMRAAMELVASSFASFESFAEDRRRKAAAKPSLISGQKGFGGGGSAGSWSPQAGGGGVGDWWTPERQQYAIDYLMEHAGLTEMGARGLVARWAGVEAPGGPSSSNAIGGGHWGIAQWSRSRARALGIWGDPDFEHQLAAVARELNGPERRAAAALRNATTPSEAATGASLYERAEGYNDITGRDMFVAKTMRTMDKMGKSVGGVIDAGGRTLYPRVGGKLHPTEAGMNPNFHSAMMRMAEDSPYGGATLMGPRSGFRSYSQQVQIAREAQRKHGANWRKWAAKPGGSRHGFGTAADLRFHSDAERKWYHDHAAEYGVYFPMGHEPWHAQMMRGAQPPPATSSEGPPLMPVLNPGDTPTDVVSAPSGQSLVQTVSYTEPQDVVTNYDAEVTRSLFKPVLDNFEHWKKTWKRPNYPPPVIPKAEPPAGPMSKKIVEVARAIAMTHDPKAVQAFMASQGHPKSGNWCASFVSSVVKSAGAQLPANNPNIASNWRKWGYKVTDPKPGDIAVESPNWRGGKTGSTGSHVFVVERTQGNRVWGVGETSSHPGEVFTSYDMVDYEFRRIGPLEK